MKFQDGGSVSFTEQGDNIKMSTRIESTFALGKCIVINMTHHELNQLIEMLVNFQESHEWDKAKRGRDDIWLDDMRMHWNNNLEDMYDETDTGE